MIERSTYIPFGNTADHSIDYLLGIIEDARATTLQRVENLSTEELHWQFAEGWNTIGALLAHIIAGEHVFRVEFIERRKLTEEESALWEPGMEMGKCIPQLITGQPVAHYMEQLRESRKLMVQAIKGLSKEAFFEKRDDYNPKTGANLAWILYHMAEDEVHHRGQVSILRKLYKML